MGEMTDTEKLYNILSNKLTWLTEYGEEVYLLGNQAGILGYLIAEMKAL